MKKVSAIALAIGIIFLAVGIALPFVSEVGTLPTVTLYQLEIACILCGGTTAVWGIIGLIFSKQIYSHCQLKTSCVAMGISATVSLGLYCVMSFLSCYFLTNPARHPIRHPASFILGTICFFVFLFLIILYIKLRKANMSVKGCVIDVVLGISYLPAFGMVYTVADTIVSEWI